MEWVQNFMADHTSRFSEGRQRAEHLGRGRPVTWKAPNSGSGVARPVEANSLLVSRGARACQGPESRPAGPTPTHQPLKLVLSEAHVLGQLVISVQGGLEDERVVRVQRVVRLVPFESGYGGEGKEPPFTLS